MPTVRSGRCEPGADVPGYDVTPDGVVSSWSELLAFVDAWR